MRSEQARTADNSTIEPPAAWSESEEPSGAGAQPDWWQHFGDPLLPQLVAQAQQANAGVQQAQASQAQALALRDVAAAGLQPTLDASASAQHGTRGSESTGNTFQAGLSGNWVPDLFGGQHGALAAAEAAWRASTADLAQAQVAVAADTALTYITLRNAQARLQVARDNLASQQQTLQLASWRQQAGLLSALEVDQARAATAQTQAQLPALLTTLAQSGHALSALTGRAPAAWRQDLSAPAAVPQPAATLALSLPADTLRQRPDIRAAEERVRAAQGRVAQADAARYPSLSIGGTLGLSALTLGSLGSGPLVTSLLASVRLPLWDGGAARAQVRAQQAALDQARASYRGSVLVALQDVEDALVALRGDRERQGHLQRAATAAAAAATLARQRFDSGLIDFQTVLETQRSQLASQDSLAVAGADISADHVRLFKALGGGWRPGAADPSPDTTRTEARTP